MADRMFFEEPVSGVRCSVALPAAFATDTKLVKGLGYPWELATIRNTELPHELDAESYGFPQIGALNSRGVVLWLVIGDRAYDTHQDSLGQAQDGKEGAEAHPRTVPQFTVKRVAGGRRREAGGTIQPSEARTTRWESIRAWSRNIDLDDSKYCELWMFAGTSPYAPVKEVAAAVEGLEFDF